MCIRVLFLVGFCGGWINGQQAPPLIATSAPQTYDPNCVDKMANCWDMPESSCHAPYEQWARDNCPNRCGICSGPTTPKPECKNKLADCEAYDKNVCTNPDYTKWVGENCRYYCRMCTPEELARMDAMQTTVPPEKCKDKVDCRAYGANACSDTFKAWSKDNCANYCGYCKGLPTPPPVCMDHIPNCKAYDADTCTNSNYRLWAEDNCKKFCGLCPGGSTGGGNGVPTPGGIAVPVPISGRDVPVISYAPPTPPKPGKRHVNAPPLKRQFHASHHHSGQTNECWDSNSSECQSETTDKLKDFPGSEFRPRPTPDKNWDSKPSTLAPVQASTTSSTVIGTKSTSMGILPSSVTSSTTVIVPPLVSNVSTMQTAGTTSESTATTSTSSPSPSSVPTKTSSNLPTELTSKTPMASTIVTSSSINLSSVPDSSVIVASKPSSTISTGVTSVTSRLPTSSSNSSSIPSLSTTTLSSVVSTSGQTEASTERKTTRPITSNTSSSSSTSKVTQIPSISTKIVYSTDGSPPTQTSSTMSTEKAPPIISTQTTMPTQPTPSTDKASPKFSQQTIASTQTISTGTPQTTVPTMPTMTSTNLPVVTSQELTSTVPCEDTVDNCIQYGPLICNNAEYLPWAKAHCSRFCDFCTPSTVTPFVCKNKKPNCNQYDSGDLCTSLAYYSWSRENCYAYCGYPPCEKTTPSMG